MMLAFSRRFHRLYRVPAHGLTADVGICGLGDAVEDRSCLEWLFPDLQNALIWLDVGHSGG